MDTGSTPPESITPYTFRLIIIASLLIGSVAVIYYLLFKKPSDILMSDISWKASSESCTVVFRITNTKPDKISGSLSIRAMSVSNSAHTRRIRASPYILGQNSFPFALEGGETQALTKEIATLVSSQCDSGQITATVVND